MLQIVHQDSMEYSVCPSVGIQITGTIASKIVPTAVSNNATPCLAVIQVEHVEQLLNQIISFLISFDVLFVW